LGARLDDLEKRVRGLAASGTEPAASPDQAVAELRAKVEALEARTAANASAPPAAQPAAPDPATEKEMERLARDIATLRTAVQTLDQSVASQREQAKSLSEAVSARSAGEQKAQQAARAAAVIGVAVRLSSALELGLPFASDLALLGSLGQGDGKLAEIASQLQPYAQAGVASTAALAAEFPAVAKAALAEDLADDSLGQRVLGKLRGLVSLRRVGNVPGDAAEAKIARAEVAIKAGHLAKAVELMKSLPPNVTTAVSGWLAKAEAHLAAEQAIDRLSAQGVQMLAASR
jgi:uroporphyrinogen-III synthase